MWCLKWALPSLRRRCVSAVLVLEPLMALRPALRVWSGAGREGKEERGKPLKDFLQWCSKETPVLDDEVFLWEYFSLTIHWFQGRYLAKKPIRPDGICRSFSLRVRKSTYVSFTRGECFWNEPEEYLEDSLRTEVQKHLFCEKIRP